MVQWLRIHFPTWNSVQCYLAAGMGEESRGEWIHVYVWLNPFVLHLKLSHRLLTGYTPMQNKKSKKKERKNLLFSTGIEGSIPGQGTKTPHATRQLRLRTTNYRPRALESLHHNQREAREPQWRSCVPPWKPGEAKINKLKHVGFHCVNKREEGTKKEAKYKPKITVRTCLESNITPMEWEDS